MVSQVSDQENLQNHLRATQVRYLIKALFTDSMSQQSGPARQFIVDTAPLSVKFSAKNICVRGEKPILEYTISFTMGITQRVPLLAQYEIAEPPTRRIVHLTFTSHLNFLIGQLLSSFVHAIVDGSIVHQSQSNSNFRRSSRKATYLSFISASVSKLNCCTNQTSTYSTYFTTFNYFIPTFQEPNYTFGCNTQYLAQCSIDP